MFCCVVSVYIFGMKSVILKLDQVFGFGYILQPAKSTALKKKLIQGSLATES